MLDSLVAHLGDMDQTFDPILDAGESAKRRQLGDRALDSLAKLILLTGPCPGLALRALN